MIQAVQLSLSERPKRRTKPSNNQVRATSFYSCCDVGCLGSRAWEMRERETVRGCSSLRKMGVDGCWGMKEVLLENQTTRGHNVLRSQVRRGGRGGL